MFIDSNGYFIYDYKLFYTSVGSGARTCGLKMSFGCSEEVNVIVRVRKPKFFSSSINLNYFITLII